MDETFLFESYYIVLFHIPLLFLLAFVNTLIFVKAKKSALLTNFLLLQGILALWMVSKLLKTFAPDAPLKFFFVVCQYAGVCFLSAFFVRFAHIFAKGFPPERKVMAALYACSAVMFLAVATNPLHHLFYSRFDFWGDSFGPLFYAQQAIQFILLLAGVLLCVRAYFASFGQKRAQAVLFAAAILIPIAANMLYVFRWFEPVFGFSPPFDITPVSASVSLALFAFATFRLELFDSLNIALETALADVPHGILHTCGGKAAYMNRTLQRMLRDGSLCTEAGASLLEYGEKTGTARLSFNLNEAQDFAVQNKNDGYIRVLSRPAEKVGAFTRFMDITEKQAALVELRSKNEELAAVNEQLSHQAEAQRRLVAARTRNAMAAEAHDILGHSVMLALSLLEMARLSDEQGRDGYIRRAADILKKGLPKLIESSAEKQERGKDIRARLYELAGELSDISVAIEVSAAEVINLSPESADALYKICRESITNALRHGRCGKIDIILKGGERETRLYVIDDGRGCGIEWRAGSGRLGIRGKDGSAWRRNGSTGRQRG
jgi:signal transduction histidine kinase